MAVPQLLVLGSLVLGVVGTATATDLVSLRAIAHTVDLPLISGAIILAREAMPSGVAHLLEPLAALAGMSALAVPLLARTLRARASAQGAPRLRLAALATTL
jgi:hypothetical protein